MAGSPSRAGPHWPAPGLKDARHTGPAHGVVSLCGRISVLDQTALERIERGGSPRGDADLGVKALDVVVGGLGRDIEPAGGFLGRMPSCDQAQPPDLAP